MKNSKIEDIGMALNKGALEEDWFYQKIDHDANTVYRCPKCDRIHISISNVNDRFFFVYRRED